MLSSTWMRCAGREGLQVEGRRHQCAVDPRVDQEAVDETERTGATQTGEHLRLAGRRGDHAQREVEIAGPRAAVEHELPSAVERSAPSCSRSWVVVSNRVNTTGSPPSDGTRHSRRPVRFALLKTISRSEIQVRPADAAPDLASVVSEVAIDP